MDAYFLSGLGALPIKYLRDGINAINRFLSFLPPHMIVVSTCISIYAIQKLKSCFQLRWGESYREYAGRIILKIPFAQNLYKADIQKEITTAQESVKRQWKPFEPFLTQIPDSRWESDELLALLHKYSDITTKALQSKHLSGAIYSKSLDHEPRHDIKVLADWNVEENIASRTSKLSSLFTEAFRVSYLWNSLHSEEFAIGTCIDFQVINMVSSMFGGTPGAAKGFVTTGGTESLMLAMRIYRNWGMKERGHAPGEGVIIACSSVHAAIEKACQSYLLNVVYIGCDREGRANLSELESALKSNGNKVIAIVGSAPSYPRGVVDPIEKMAKLAQNYGCPMHVDCCLGGFIVNHLPQHNTKYLTLPGVTSLSADTHKNGMAPKGSSVLVTRKINGQDLATLSTYVIPGWSGGVYGTSRDPGSQSCVQNLCALVAMLSIGSKGYQEIATLTHGTTRQLATIIKKFPGRLRLLAEPDVNVVSFEIDPRWGLKKGAIYALADEMYKNNIALNKLHNQAVHFCVTLRFAANPSSLTNFYEILDKSLAALEQLNGKLVKEDKGFSGTAGMYGALNAALKPNSHELSSRKYIENLIMGSIGAKDAIRAHVGALRNPFC